jgi:3'-phosphoadenosine 5'-phosphosulfate sulfotransferase
VYYSDSREEYVDIMELDIVHAIRILRKHVGHDEYYEESKTLGEIT